MPRHAPHASRGRTPARRSETDPTGGRLRAPDRPRRRPGGGSGSGPGPGSGPGATTGERLHFYLDLSRQPLQILIFLLPLIVFYQVGLWYYSPAAAAVASGQSDAEAMASDGTLTPPSTVISAYEILHDLFGLFGATSLYFPGALVVTVLLVWHVLRRDRWRVHAGVPMVMLVESIALAMPLLVLDQFVARFAGGEVLTVPLLTPLADVVRSTGQAAGAAISTAVYAVQGGPESILATHSWLARLVISVGAGVYEELLFRLLLIGVVHLVVVDVLRAHPRTGDVIAMFFSALAFAFYHDLSPGGLGGPGIELRLLLFYALAGLYFAALLVVRGFGIVVGAHAMYDAFVIVLLPAITGGPSNPLAGTG